MKTLIIRRISNGENGVFGAILFKGIPFALTLEREDLNNQSNISCVPRGTYSCKRVNSPRFGHTFEVMNVPSRTHILFHKGNLSDDSHGCILLGEQFGDINGNSGILSSRAGYDEFMALLAGENEFRLIIVNDFLTDLEN